MSGTIQAGMITDGTNTALIEQVVRGSAKSWVVFNGTGTVVIYNSYTIGSIIDNGVGNYTLNFTTSMSNLNYAYSGSGRWTSANSAAIVGQNSAQVKTLSSLPIIVSNSTTAVATDLPDVTVIIHGD